MAPRVVGYRHGDDVRDEGGAMSVVAETLRTKVPARMDRLPWSRWHWLMIWALGTVWVLDGLEVTIKGTVGAQLKDSLGFSTVQVGGLASVYLLGAVVGALFWGYLTDRFGRKKLFMITLVVYMIGVVSTVLAGVFGLGIAYIWFACARFVTGFGIGGEYAAVNSTIDELMPARVRGWVALAINGSWWLGTLFAAGLGVLYLNIFPENVGWRVAFGMGAIIALAVLMLRFWVPESPRWLITHGRPEEAEKTVDQIEDTVHEQTGEQLREPRDDIEMRMRRSVGFLEIAKTMFGVYPRRTVVALSLMIGQAFLYNAIFFTYGLMLTTYFGISAASVGLFLMPFAVGNFVGPLLLGRLFDTWGRRVMIPGTFVLAAVLTVATGWLFMAGNLSAVWITVAWTVIFFFASAGASSGYLTASETFPMEIRAMVIAFVYAVGTAIGGISGPLLYSALISGGSRERLFLGYCVGAGVMLAAGIVHRFLGVEAGQKSLEDVAAPLSAEDAEDQKSGEQNDGDEDSGHHDAGNHEAGNHEAGNHDAGNHGSDRRAPQTVPRRQRPALSGLPFSSDTGGEDVEIGEETDTLVRALAADGPTTRAGLSRRVRSRFWGPGRYHEALRNGLREGRIRRAGHGNLTVPDEERERLGTGGR
jgi:MFS family permease